MIAFRFARPPALKGTSVPGVAHNVTADGDDWVARCGERWPRGDDGACYPSGYSGEVCRACKEAA